MTVAARLAAFCAWVTACTAVACSAGGRQGDGMRDLPNGGVGPFRRLTSDEVPTGYATPGRGGVVESGMVLGGSDDSQAMLYYAFAAIGSEAPGGSSSGFDWAAFGPRAIHRSPAATGPYFPEGPAVLEAEQEWEGGEVFDPWAVMLPGRAVRLYYAAAGGIGAVQAETQDSAFERQSPLPVLAGSTDVAGGAVPRRPTVVERPGGGYSMYFEAGGSLYAIDSADGLTFGIRDAARLALDVRADAGVPELSLAGPGAVRTTTAAGRSVVRLYFESHRVDGTSALCVAASEDGVLFERAEPVAYTDKEHGGFPSPWIIDSRVSLLYFTVDRSVRDTPSRGLAAAVTPATVRFESPGD